jgi:capsular exopolysaccharide synthesis family protein
MDKRLKYATDVFNLPGGRLIGVVPDISDDPTDASRVEMVVRDHPSSVVSESFRQCCAGVMQSIEASGAKSIMIASGLPESGTTSVAINLAITAIHSGRKVAVVDANFRRPRISDLMGLDPSEPGLGEVLSEESSLSSVTKATQDGLVVIPAGSPAYRIYERLNTSRFSAMLDELSASVDLVIIDVPPLVVAGEGIAISSRVDASILVARAYSEQKGLVIRLIRQLTSQPSEFLGIILNRPRTTAGGYFKKNFAAMANYTPTHTESDDS